MRKHCWGNLSVGLWFYDFHVDNDFISILVFFLLLLYCCPCHNRFEKKNTVIISSRCRCCVTFKIDFQYVFNCLSYLMFQIEISLRNTIMKLNLWNPATELEMERIHYYLYLFIVQIIVLSSIKWTWNRINLEKE